MLYLCPPWGRAGGGVGGVRQVRIDRTSSRVKLACDCDGDGGDDNDVTYDDDDGDGGDDGDDNDGDETSATSSLELPTTSTDV